MTAIFYLRTIKNIQAVNMNANYRVGWSTEKALVFSRLESRRESGYPLGSFLSQSHQTNFRQNLGQKSTAFFQIHLSYLIIPILEAI
jgi:hypothetical protein